MNVGHKLVIALAIATTTSCVLAKPASDASQAGVTVSGTAGLIAAAPEASVKDASKIVVWLSPVDAVRPISAFAGRTRYRLVQHHKRFEPGLLVVPVGSVVDFPNEDPWFHNVFSLYRGKRFDLGLYQAGSQRSVKFDRIGPSYLFCNIHPGMTGVVLAVDTSFFGISDKAGHYSIADVPPGNYTIHVWYENAKPESLKDLQKTVVVEGENRALPAISIAVVKQPQKNHK